MAQICPYCRAPVESTDAATNCEGCGTPHHSECYEENGGCTLFGCKFAPPDDPKVAVTVGEVSYATPLGAAVAVAYGPSTGFGDVNAPVMVAPATLPGPPPPPPPGTELRGEPEQQPGVLTAGSTLLSAPVAAPKSRLAFILLGIFLGSFGAHNFYAGYKKRGLMQLGLTVVTVFYGSLVTWIWALVEVCTVDCDKDQVSFV